MSEWRKEQDMHPWSFIAEELLARGWDVQELALRMAIPNYDEVLKETARNMLVLDLYRFVGPTDPRCKIGESGKAIARAFGVSEDQILNLESAWRADPPTTASAFNEGAEG